MVESPRDAAYTKVLTPRGSAPPPAEAALVQIGADDVAKKSKATSDDSSDRASDKKKPKKGGKGNRPPPVPFSDLYRYATPRDKVYLALGALFSVGGGVMFPCMSLIFGKAIGGFQNADGSVDIDMVNSAALDYVYIAIALFIVDYGSYVLLTTTAERQMKLLRTEALHHMLYMDIPWYDAHDAMQLSTRLTGDTVKIKEGMGSKLGEAIKYASQFVAGYVIGFVKGWDMALVMACVMPLMFISMTCLMKMIRSKIVQSQQLYAEGGAIAEETLGSIRTVASLNAEKRAIDAYHVKCLVVEDLNVQLVKRAAIALGFAIGSMWLMYATGLWYGGYRVSQAKATPVEVFQGFFGVLMGTMAISMISPSLQAVTEARGAAATLYQIIDTPSAIDASKDEGFIPETCAGHIQAVDLHFAYPSRLDAPILQGYNVTIEAGQTVAFVGASGGGKSTLIALLERYYNPGSGQLLLDGRDIGTLNLKWLRSQIGVVSQEPVLFAQTIMENIQAGGENVTREQAIEAAKMANAHKFIMTLPQQYETLVGEKGVSMSGGQKQRIAIARAVVRNPKILVLDEATSALDAESERIVQDALNDLMDKTQMTTLVIAHRLSTVRRADKIVVLSGGRVVEEGNHNDLMAIENGLYNNLYTIQEGKAKEEAEAAAAELKESAEANDGANRLRQRSMRSSRSGEDGNADADSQDEEDDKKKTKFSLLDALKLSEPERKYFLVGTAVSLVMGFAMPGSALLISQLLASMVTNYAKFEATGDRAPLNALYDDVTIYGAIYLGGAVAMWALRSTSTFCYRFMAQKLTTRVRMIQFSALVRQNIAFFDEKEHGTGALTADLSTHATNMANISGDTMGRLVECVFTFAAAMIISFTLGSWLLSFMLLIIFPMIAGSQALRSRTMRKMATTSDELAEMGAHASEALCNMRTVVALGLEDRLRDKFSDLLEKPLVAGRKEARINGSAFGFSSFIVFATYALVFWYGGKLVQKGDIQFVEMMRTLMAVMMSAQGVGIAASFLGDSEYALKAGRAVTALRDRELPIDSFDEGGERPAHVEGKIEFRDVTFRYPTRPGVTVLKHYNLTIEPGQTVAFCGPSGGGKSTCISLLERFYDPVEGQVLLDGRDVKSLNVQWLRSQLGLVGQEPTLFIGTIAQNIAYGLETMPSQEEIEAAAKMANAHDFIVQFPDGYATQVGMKGEQLSGGQKQRIAIARAVLKNANVLLLDEATSALDSESEKIVQEALDKVVALKKRTTIIIAHRLSTIRKADKICVVSGGKIAEQGTHAELLAQNGIYTKLVQSATN